MRKSFSKYHGRGNDFILIDDRNNSFPLCQQTIQKLCQRHFGIGADGLILLQDSDRADLRMRIFNSDGFEAKGCGNGLLCLLTFVRDQEILDEIDLSVETFDRIVFAKREDRKYVIDMGIPKNLKLNHQVSLKDKKLFCHLVDTGVKHVVVFVDNLDELDIKNLGREIRFHKDFYPEGVNVNFVEKNKEYCKVRTYERGVEGETFACGTGACAVGVILSKLGENSEQKIVFEKGHLDIFTEIENVKMKGDATYVFSGIVQIDNG